VVSIDKRTIPDCDPRRIFFLPNGANVWLDAARDLKNLGHEIPLFLGDDRLITEFKEIYPKAKTLGANLFKNGYFSRRMGRPTPTFVREHQIFREYHGYALYSIERLTTVGQISYLDRRAYITALTDYLFKIIEDASCSHVVMGEAPHTVEGLLAIGICEVLKMPIIHFQQSGIAPLVRARLSTQYHRVFFGRESHRGEVPAHASATDVQMFVNRHDCFAQTIEQAIKQFEERLESAIAPTYEVDHRKEDERFYGARGLLRRVTQVYYMRRPFIREGTDKSLTDSPHLQQYSVKRFASSEIWRTLRQACWNSRRIRHFNTLARPSQEPLDDGPCLTLFLQKEPELTSLPEAGCHSDQIAVARSLALSLPREWRLVIREHPSQLLFSTKGFVGRSRLFYEELSSLPRTVFQDPDLGYISAIRGSRCIATLSGNVAVEARMLGVPVMAFGRPWYEGLRGCEVVRDLSGVAEALERACSEEMSSPLMSHELREFLEGYFFCLVSNPSGVDKWGRAGVPIVQDRQALAEILGNFLSRPSAQVEIGCG